MSDIGGDTIANLQNKRDESSYNATPKKLNQNKSNASIMTYKELMEIKGSKCTC